MRRGGGSEGRDVDGGRNQFAVPCPGSTLVSCATEPPAVPLPAGTTVREPTARADAGDAHAGDADTHDGERPGDDDGETAAPAADQDRAPGRAGRDARSGPPGHSRGSRGPADRNGCRAGRAGNVARTRRQRAGGAAHREQPADEVGAGSGAGRGWRAGPW